MQALNTELRTHNFELITPLPPQGGTTSNFEL